MQVTITAKIQICVIPEHRKLLDVTMDEYRHACDYTSDYIFRTHDLKQYSLNQHLYHDIRNKFGLKSQMAQSVIKTVAARYKTILENQRHWIKPKFRKLQYDLVWNRDYSLSQNLFSVNTLSGRIKSAYYPGGIEKYFDKETYRFGTAKLVKKGQKYYLHIPVTKDVPECDPAEITNIVGIDRGINFIAATYDSHGNSCFISGKKIKQKRAKYKQLRTDLQRRQTPSSRRRLKAIGQRENRWMQDVNHCVSKALVEMNPKHSLFVLEDLSGIRNATERVRRKDRYMSVSWSFYDLEQKIKYKAVLNESLVINTDPKYTSQTCPVCRHTEKGNRNKKLHLFECRNCGYKSNDDRIGAMNLYQKGISFVAERQRIDTVAAE